MPRVKEPVLVSMVVRKAYVIDIEGTKINAYYNYDMDNEQASGWEYDLTPCYVDLDEDEIFDLEEEVHVMLTNTKE
jgi:hypothetical protein